MNSNLLNTRYEYLEEQFEKYKQSKEIEICSLRMDLERIKRQLTDKTQEKLDLLLKNQQLLQNELVLRLSSTDTLIQTQTAEDFLQSTPDKITKKRKLTSLSIDREYDYYS
jgi:RNA polymerase-interacting CarD/CdnL/TRCF family regulator